MPNNFATIILAAGMGKRMMSDLPKVLHPFAGKPLIHHVIDQAKSVGSDKIVLVIGHGRDLVIEATTGMNVEYAIQEQQLGTGDAVQACKNLLGSYRGDVLILSGDVPLLKSSSIVEAHKLHQSTQSVATVFTFIPATPEGYGRILRDGSGNLVGIVEHKDATPEQRLVGEVNAGIYFFDNAKMFKALENVKNDNAAGEFYLTDTIAVLAGWGEKQAGYIVADALEVEGINSPDQLKALESEWLRCKSS